jgi:eukaryotic-like serine/threonine-protein kinase
MTERDVFEAALEVPPEARATFLDSACGGNTTLRQRLDGLLRKHDRAGNFLENPAVPEVALVNEPPPSDAAGRCVGPYLLLEPIGEGGFGIVYVAEQQQPLRRQVALKILKPGMDTRQVVARFEAERQALALMDHPNIAKVLDAGQTATGRPYFVMELVKGLPITDYCDQSQLPPRQRLELFLHVCQAVQHAHLKGIIHRDLKPSNVLVTLQDGRPEVKVIDFGIAKALGQQLTDKTLLTGFAQMIGTPLYMAPEQATLSNADVDTRSDIYSLGALLYELLTGTTPIAKERLKEIDYDELRRLIREEEPPKPSTRLRKEERGRSKDEKTTPNSRLWRMVRHPFSSFRVHPSSLQELDWIVMKCLEKDRERRYESVSAFAADIRRYLDDEPVHACPPSVGYRLGKFLRRKKGPVLAASLVLLALLAGLFGAAYGLLESWKQNEVTSLWQEAEAARGRAETAREGEAKAKREAEQAREMLAAVEYGRTLQVAHQEWRENNVAAALALLDSTRADFRGWEWRYLHRLCHSDLITFQGHTDFVFSASFSPDQARVVTASKDGTARLWNAQTGTELLVLRGHTAGVLSASFSPDGNRLVTASMDKTARVWDAQTGAELLLLQGHTAPVCGAVFSPDGFLLATTSRDRTTQLWDATTGAKLRTLSGRGASSFSPDGVRILTVGVDRTARVWDTKTGTQRLLLKGPDLGILAASFSPDGARIVTACGDGTARIWDAMTGAEVRRLQGHDGGVNSASFSADGARIVTASHDKTVRVCNADTGAELCILKGHTHTVASALFSLDGSRVLTASWDKTARIWDTASQTEARTLQHTGSVFSASFSPEGTRLLTSDKTARVWDAQSAAQVLNLRDHLRSVHTASFSPDGTRIVTTSWDRTATIWDAKTGAEIRTLDGHTDIVYAASFSPDGTRIVTASEDKTARLWDTQTGTEIHTFHGHSDPVFSASFNRDGSRVLTGSQDKTARVWDAMSGIVLLTLQGRGHAIHAASFSADGSRIVAWGHHPVVFVWDAVSGTELLTLRGHTGALWSASFSPDGSRIVTGSVDRTARLWDATTGAELLVLKGHSGTVCSASFSSDGSRIVTASGDGTVRIWDATPVNREFLLKDPTPRPHAPN